MTIQTGTVKWFSDDKGFGLHLRGGSITLLIERPHHLLKRRTDFALPSRIDLTLL